MHRLTRDILSLSPDDGVDTKLSWMPEDFANSGRVSDKVKASKEAGLDNHSMLYHDLSSFSPTSLSRDDLRALLGELQKCFFCHLECIIQHGIDHLQGKSE